jgi:hypothetical protein
MNRRMKSRFAVTVEMTLFGCILKLLLMMPVYTVQIVANSMFNEIIEAFHLPAYTIFNTILLVLIDSAG